MDSNVQRIRELMNSNPKEVGKILIWYMANPAGDDPRVLALCSEIIEKSTNTASIGAAIGGVASVIDAHRREKSLTARHKSEIAAVLRNALKITDPAISFSAAGQLKRLGGKYKEAARDFYLDYLRQRHEENDPATLRRYYIGAVRELIEHGRPEDRDVIRQVTKEFGLLDFLERSIPAIDHPAIREQNEQLLKRWKALMASGGGE